MNTQAIAEGGIEIEAQEEECGIEIEELGQATAYYSSGVYTAATDYATED